MKNKILALFFVVSLFSIAMGFLETAVVVYLRELHFPGGFKFPMAPIERNIAVTELLRELATVIMLIGVGYMAGRNFASRFGWFLYSWAIWDIFYYVFLKLLLDWPESFLTYDVLFLIPVIWIGPVITPIFVSCLMILLAYFLIKFDFEKKDVYFSKIEWILFASGSNILIIGFAWDYGKFVIQNYSFSKIWVWPTNNVLMNVSNNYIPQGFNWPIYFLGVIIIISGIILFWKRYTSKLSD